MTFNLPIIGILRGAELEQLPRIVHALRDGGLQSLEITMNSPRAADQIALATRLGENTLAIGAGTVTSIALLHTALGAGATFIVTPTIQSDVIQECVKQGVPVFPGALSPTEILQAWEMGATMVKIFPAEMGGPAYLKSLRGPFPKIKFMPTGGVNLQTLPEFVAAGAAGVGVGSPLLDRERLAAHDWPWLQEQARRYVRCWTQRSREQR